MSCAAFLALDHGDVFDPAPATLDAHPEPLPALRELLIAGVAVFGSGRGEGEEPAGAYGHAGLGAGHGRFDPARTANRAAPLLAAHRVHATARALDTHERESATLHRVTFRAFGLAARA